MELLYLIMMGASAIGIMYYIMIYWPRARKKLPWLVFSLFVVFVIGFIGTLHEGDVEKADNAKELKSMGFTHVNMLFNSGADVASSSSCPVALRLNKNEDYWIVVSDEIASEKPVVDSGELFGRKEIKWWCSKPPTKN